MKKLLIVDDQAAIRKLLFEVLNDEFEIDFASTGEEAIEVAQEFKPDIILLDVGLVGMSGIDALPALKRIVPGSRIIMLTGNIDSYLIKEAVSLGAYDFIEKPFDIFNMKIKLQNILSEKMAK